MDETTEMQAQIEEKLGLDPVDKSVVVLYEGEKQEKVSLGSLDTVAASRAARITIRCSYLFRYCFSAGRILGGQACGRNE